MKVLFVSNILPMQIVDLLNMSIAGKKYEIMLTEALNTKLHGNLDIVSISRSGRKEANKLKLNEIFEGKKYKQLVSINFPIISDFVRNIHFLSILLWWGLINIKKQKVVIILNSPFGICLSALIMKIIFGIKPVSLTLDTPFLSENSFKGLLGWYNKTTFLLGHRSLIFFSGIIVLNEKAVEVLKLKIPYIVSKVGYNETNYNFNIQDNKSLNKSLKKKIIFYAGTLIQNKGILTLIEAVRLLDKNEYELHLCGYGPLENEILKYAENNENIIFHGRLDNSKYLKALSSADLLVNPTVTNDPADNFSFPSKIVEYILSGRPVLTTKSNSLPKEYYDYLFLIDKETPEGFAEAIKNVFIQSESFLREKCEGAVRYIRRYQNWGCISSNMVDFISNI